MTSFTRSAKTLIIQIISSVQHYLPSKSLLIFLLILDNWLYYLQGQTAIAYGNGLHPKHRLTGYHDFFTNRIQPEERVLDVGCGIGYLAFDVAEKTGAFVLGVDINPDNISQALDHFSHPNIRYQVGDIQKFLPEEHFDVIILSNVLEHLPDRPKFLRRMQTNFGPSKLLIRVPLFERDWRVPLKRELGIDWRLDPTHEIEYTPESFNAELVQAGMEVIYKEIRWGEIWAEVQSSHNNSDL
jgi:SAM-dependent methyltransferase